jgi:Prp8 binding protein
MGEVFATRFDPTAQNIASGSMDRNISTFFLGVFKKHGSILKTAADSDLIFLFSVMADVRTMRKLWPPDRA